MAYTEAFIKNLLDTSGFGCCVGFKPTDSGDGATLYWGNVPLATVRAGKTESEYHVNNNAVVEQMEKLLAETTAMEVV